jgi:beta-lactamase class A
MIIISDNTAANLLIDMAGMDNVNKMAEDMGLRSTKLQRRMMDSAAARAGRENLTCAVDMHHILKLIYEGKAIDEYYSCMMPDILKRQQVGGRLNLYLPDDITIAHKTGDLDRLEHDVGIVYLPGCDYIICVLTNKTITNKDGREIIGKISKAVYDCYIR